MTDLPGDGEHLPCGADVDALLEQVAEGRGENLTAHQSGCVHCRAALVELRDVWAPVQRLAAESVVPPPGLVAAVMGRVQRLVQDVWYTVELTEGGAIRIAARVVAVVARDAAGRVPGVRAALGRSTEARLLRLVERATLGHRHPHAAVGVLGRTAVVDIALAVDYGEPVRRTAEQVQQAVVDELRRAIGLQTVVVNVVVDDVIPPPPRH